MNVFISHSNYEDKFVQKLQNGLSESNFSFFSAYQIRPGEDWFIRVKEEIERADIVLVILSNKSLNSQWVNSEISLALSKKYENSSKVIIPILTEKLKERPFFISDLQYLDFSDASQFNANLKVLDFTLSSYQEQKAEKVTYEFKGSGGISISKSESNSAKVEFLNASRDHLNKEKLDFVKKQENTIRSISLGLISSIVASLIISGITFLPSWEIFTNNFDLVLSFIFGVTVAILTPYIYTKIKKRIYTDGGHND